MNFRFRSLPTTTPAHQLYTLRILPPQERGDINDNAMIRGGEGLGKLVAEAEDVHKGSHKKFSRSVWKWL